MDEHQGAFPADAELEPRDRMVQDTIAKADELLWMANAAKGADYERREEGGLIGRILRRGRKAHQAFKAEGQATAPGQEGHTFEFGSFGIVLARHTLNPSTDEGKDALPWRDDAQRIEGLRQLAERWGIHGVLAGPASDGKPVLYMIETGSTARATWRSAESGQPNRAPADGVGTVLGYQIGILTTPSDDDGAPQYHLFVRKRVVTGLDNDGKNIAEDSPMQLNDGDQMNEAMEVLRAITERQSTDLTMHYHSIPSWLHGERPGEAEAAAVKFHYMDLESGRKTASR